MKNLKKEIFKLTKKYCEKNEIDILDIELASLALYSILKNDYFKGSFEYLRLGKNEFDEYCMFHMELKGISVYSNNTVGSRVIIINESDDAISRNKPEFDDFIYSDEEKEYLYNLNHILINNTSLKKIVEEINNLNKAKQNNSIFYGKMSNLFEKDNIFQYIDKFIEYNSEEEQDYIKKNFKIENYKRDDKEDFYLNSLVNNFSVIQNTGFTTELIKIAKESKEKAIDFCIEKNIIKEDIQTIRSSNLLYKNSVLDIIDNCDFSEMINVLERFMEVDFESIKRTTMLNIKNILSGESEEEAYNIYKKDIDVIKNEIYKKFPKIKSSISIQDIAVSEISPLDNKNTKELFNDVVFSEIYNSSYIDFINTATTNGLSEMAYYYKNKSMNENNNQYFLKIKNDYELLSIFDIRKAECFRSSFNSENYTNIKEIKIFGISCINKSNFDLNIIKAGIQKVIDSVDDKTILTYEFADANSYTEHDKIVFKNLFQEVLNENGHILTMDLHRNTKINNTYTKRIIKTELVKGLDAGIYNYSQLIPIFKKVDALSYEFLSSIDRYNNRDEKVKDLIEDLFKESPKSNNKNKFKV